MKVRQGFVSNSSSASFILELYTNDETLTKEDVKNIIECKIGFLNKLSDTDLANIQEGIEKVNSQKFIITSWTAIFNGPEDIPWYMKDFYMLYKLYPEDSGFWKVDLRVDEGFI